MQSANLVDRFDMNRTDRRGKKPIKYMFSAGQRVGKLTVIGRGPDAFAGSKPYRVIQWKCQCDCGEEVFRRSNHLRRGGCMCKDCKARIDADKFKYQEIWHHHWYMIQRYAKLRDISFNITIEYAWSLFIQQDRKCKLSGKPIGFSPTKKGHSTGDTTASLDRIDSAIGYVEGNVQWLHKWVNMMKSDFSTKEFIQYCTDIVEHNKHVKSHI